MARRTLNPVEQIVNQLQEQLTKVDRELYDYPGEPFAEGYKFATKYALDIAKQHLNNNEKENR